jgi:hypothetical protein
LYNIIILKGKNIIPLLKDEVYYVRFEVFTAVTMKNCVFWMLRHVALVRTDVSEEPGAAVLRGTIISELGTTQAASSNRFLHSVCQLLGAACVVSSSPILVTLMEAPGSSETTVLTRATWRNIPEDTILHEVYCSEQKCIGVFWESVFLCNSLYTYNVVVFCMEVIYSIFPLMVP